MILLGCGLTAAVILSWLTWELLPERVMVSGNQLLRKHRGETQCLLISEIQQVRYHYHAVVGFIAVWECIDQHGTVLTIDAKAFGMSRVLQTLETKLPEFSLDKFHRQFEAGDVEDTLEVWNRS